MIEITKNEAQGILTIMDRVQISGKEAMAVAQLQVKLSKAVEEAPDEVVEEKEEEKKS